MFFMLRTGATCKKNVQPEQITCRLFAAFNNKCQLFEFSTYYRVVLSIRGTHIVDSDAI